MAAECFGSSQTILSTLTHACMRPGSDLMQLGHIQVEFSTLMKGSCIRMSYKPKLYRCRPKFKHSGLYVYALKD